MAACIDIELAAGVARIALARPEVHNAFDDTLIRELTEALDTLAGDADLRALVLTGHGSTFSAGADLQWMRRMVRADHDTNYTDALGLATLLRRLAFFPRPVIARVNGSAYGGGVGLVACCDIAIGVEEAKFALSEVKLGLAPATIAPWVVAAIGVRHARRLFVSGEVFSATEALRIDLLHQCVAAAELDDAVDRQLHFLRKGGPQAQVACKRLAWRMAGMTPQEAEAVDTENAALIAQLRVSPEGQEGLTAFLDKRKPTWA